MRDKKPVSKLICYTDPKNPAAEAFRTLRTNIQFASQGEHYKSLMITSAEPGEGKTTTITNLAIVLSQSGIRLLLLDGDMRKPALHRVFRLENNRGLSDLLYNRAQIDEVVRRIPDIDIDVITAGQIPANPAELINSPQMRLILEQLQNRYDMVLIDAPPILPVTDSQLFATLVQGVLLVVRSGKVKMVHVKKAKMLLEHVGGNLIGAILNDKIVSKNKDYYYGYIQNE